MYNEMNQAIHVRSRSSCAIRYLNILSINDHFYFRQVQDLNLDVPVYLSIDIVEHMFLLWMFHILIEACNFFFFFFKESLLRGYMFVRETINLFALLRLLLKSFLEFSLIKEFPQIKVRKYRGIGT